MAKTDCFEYKNGECMALKDLDCDKCRFYKTQDQVDKEREKSKGRLTKLGMTELIDRYKINS